MWFSFLTTLCFYSALVGQHLPQILFQATSQDTKAPKIITPELSNYVEQTLKTYDVPGMSLAVVRKDGTVELGAWGHKTENGDPATPDVSLHMSSKTLLVLEVIISSCYRLCTTSHHAPKLLRLPQWAF